MSKSNIVIINGLNSRSGGGLVIFTEFLRQKTCFEIDTKYIIILPKGINHDIKENYTNIKLVEFPHFINNYLLLGVFYYFFLPIIFYIYKPKFILNFGDVVIPFVSNQIYFFDWAYAFIEKKITINNFSSFTRRIKILQIKRNIKNVKKIICQTELIKEQFKSKFLIPDDILFVLPTPPVIYSEFKMNKNLNYKIFNKKFPLILFYPTSLSSHKNIDYIFKLATTIDKLSLPVKFKLTICKKDLDKFYPNFNLSENIQLCGTLNHYQVIQEMFGSHFLFFPSLLESYGLPLVEAMSISKPILVSDLDYAKVICGDAADYFNPYNTNSALDIIMNILSGNFMYDIKISKLFLQKKIIPNWESFAKELLKLN